MDKYNKMQCEFYYCIYNSENKCILNEIEIDELGMCGSCEIFGHVQNP